ncbi:endolytic transglycosylase MltG [Anaeroselena agilis]|uniref:Endolytic murein transglycosylase n=1 Tax=Anaeroselena agilis TaxID=3063788 RepID=A0ABU3NW46_9FIRM|nr:endolytic transglycosylase MltG [Selenomonadales bacterium 4137-cl]
MLQLDKQIHKWLIAIVIAGVFVLAAGSAVYSLARPVNASAGDAIMVVVKPGMATQAIGELLHDKGLIKNVLIFRVMAKMEGMEGSLQAGEYSFSKAMTVREIIGKLVRGETAYRQFTIPEGFTIDQIAALLEKNKLASAAKYKAVAAGYAPYDYIRPAANVKYQAEGFVFPDTYRVAAGTSEAQLVKMMMSQFDSQFTPTMRERAAELGLSVREVVILASLVEKEAQLAAERPVIAGVFLRRLKLGMPLQSCATIQYILGYPKPELTVQDTEIPSPYNTYQNMGLPPGPIASPGLASIKAVLYPADTEYLYFFANKDGSHVFSRTYEEHLAAINRDDS